MNLPKLTQEETDNYNHLQNSVFCRKSTCMHVYVYTQTDFKLRIYRGALSNIQSYTDIPDNKKVNAVQLIL